MANIGNKFLERSNTELEQALIRFVFGVLVGAYFIFGFQPEQSPNGALSIPLYAFLTIFFVISLSLVFANLYSSQASMVRRGIGICLDMSSISYCLYLGDEQSAFVFSLYLWVLVGNGLRFGKRYLWAAMIAALLGFSLVLSASVFWRHNLSLSIGVYFLIVALPLYFSKLLTRLQNVNDDLEHRVEQRTKELAVEKNNALASSRAKTQFLANMSHELRTPLNAIIGYSELLIEDAEQGSQTELVEDLHRINSSGQHLLAMISDILDLSRIEAGKVKMQPQCFALFPFVDEILKSVSPMLLKTGNKISIDRSNEKVEIESDKTRLKQILLNLLGNAIKFTQNGSIHVAIYQRRSGWIEIQVEDNGIGIDGEHLGTIFDAFTQVDQSFTRHFGGSGLGLAICKRYSKLMGGDISVTSEPKMGSTFTLSLPQYWQGEVENEITVKAS